MVLSLPSHTLSVRRDYVLQICLPSHPENSYRPVSKKTYVVFVSCFETRRSFGPTDLVSPFPLYRLLLPPLHTLVWLLTIHYYSCTHN